MKCFDKNTFHNICDPSAFICFTVSTVYSVLSLFAFLLLCIFLLCFFVYVCRGGSLEHVVEDHLELSHLASFFIIFYFFPNYSCTENPVLVVANRCRTFLFFALKSREPVGQSLC